MAAHGRIQIYFQIFRLIYVRPTAANRHFPTVKELALFGWFVYHLYFFPLCYYSNETVIDITYTIYSNTHALATLKHELEVGKQERVNLILRR